MLVVFISSPFRGMEAERRAVVEAVRQLGLEARLLEEFGATSKTVEQTVSDAVARSDIFVLLLDGSMGRWVQLEYQRANQFGLPVLIFARGSADSAVREEILAEQVVAYYRDPSHLRDLVKQSLVHVLSSSFHARGQTLSRHNDPKELIAKGAGDMAAGSPSEAIPSLRKALKEARTRADGETELAALDNLGTAYRQVGRYDDAAACYSCLLERGKELNSKHARTLAQLQIAALQSDLGAQAEAEAQFRVGLKMAGELGDNTLEARALTGLAGILMQQRQMEEAAHLLYQASKTQAEIGDREGLAASYSRLARVHLLSGSLEDARKFAERAADIGLAAGNVRSSAESLLILGSVYAAERHNKQARDYFRRAAELFERIGDPSGSARARLKLPPNEEALLSISEA